MSARLLLAIVVFCFVWAVTGCGDEGRPPTVSSNRDASVRDAASATDGGLPDASSCNGVGSPVVNIEVPQGASDPNADEILTSGRVSVHCSVTASTLPGATEVDEQSVRIMRVDDQGLPLDTPPVSGQFEAAFNLEDVSNGPVRFRCSALDMSSSPLCGLEDVETFLDLGPDIEVIEPVNGSFHADNMQVRYRLSAAPVSDADEEAGIAGHTLVVAGQLIEDVSEESPGEYLANIDFNDTTVFPQPLDGPNELSIVAWNERTPTSGERTVQRAFTVDEEGPMITFVTPTEGALVGGLVEVQVEITDPASVNLESIVLVPRQDDDPLPMSPVAGMPNVYSASFDGGGFASTVLGLVLQVTATDLVGNTRTASRSVKLDSVPPFVSLDPPRIRVGRIQSDLLRCSTPFDPVGEDSAVDGEVLGTAAEFRARVQDRGNVPFGGDGTVVTIAGVDTQNVDLYLLDDTSTPLLVDRDGDDICDEINPDVMPVAGGKNTSIVVELQAVEPDGASYFWEGADFLDPIGPPEYYGDVFDECTAGTQSSAPDALCIRSSPLTEVIYATYDTDIPAIYAMPPLVDDTTCVGDSFDFQSSLSEGWACVAVRAEDALGNVNVSTPLRTCFTDGSGANPCPVSVGMIAPEDARPSCTDGCTPAASFQDVPALQLVRPPD